MAVKFELTAKLKDMLQIAVNNAMADFHTLDGEIDRLKEAFENRSDNWKEGDKGTEAEEYITKLETIRDAMETLQEAIEDVDGIND